MHTMRQLINLVILILHCHMVCVSAIPGIVDSPESRKLSREKAKPTSLNSITPAAAEKSDVKPVEEFQPIKITHNDIVQNSNSVYGSQSPFSSGGIIFAITGQSSATPIMSAAASTQPVLLQYLSPEGMPKQTAIQYVQLLRPLMMVPAQSYLPARSVSATTMPIETATTTMIDMKLNPYGPYMKSLNSLVGAHSSPLLSFFNSNPRPLITPTATMTATNGNTIGLNTNEYIPAASSRIAMSVKSPQVPNISMTGFKPSNFPIMAQRA